MDIEPESSRQTEGSAAEVEELRAALRDAEAKLDKKAKRSRGRGVLAASLVVLTSIVFTVAISAAWTRRTLFNTGQWVRTVTPVVEHDSVTDALSERLTSELLIVIDAESLAAEALPPRAQLLSGPIVGAVEDFVGEKVHEVLGSERFQEFWVNANRFAHTQIMAVLKGDDEGALTNQEGVVTLNLIPVMNEVLVRVEERANGLLGSDVDLPEITGGEVPDEARAKLEAALGVDLPDTLGEIVIFESDKLEAAQEGLKTIDKFVVVLLVAALLLIALTLWASKRRRRTVIQLSAGILIGLVFVRRIVIYMQDQAVDLAKPENQDAMRAIVDDLMRNFFRLTTFLIAIGLLAILVAILTAPYPWVVRMRARTRETARGLANSISNKAQDDATTTWVRGHRDALQIGGVVFLVVMLLAFDFSWIGFFVLCGVVALFELAVQRISHDEPPGPPPGGPVAVGGK